MYIDFNNVLLLEQEIYDAEKNYSGHLTFIL